MPLAALFNLCFSQLQAQVAGKTLLAFAHHRTDRCLNDMLLQQNLRQKRQIFPQDGFLQGHAAGGDHDRLDQCRGTLLLPEHTGHQIGQRFADADPGLTEQNFFVEQGIQHGVAEGNLPLAHGHAVGGQQIAENMFRLPVRPPVPAFVVHFCFFPR